MKHSIPPVRGKWTPAVRVAGTYSRYLLLIASSLTFIALPACGGSAFDPEPDMGPSASELLLNSPNLAIAEGETFLLETTVIGTSGTVLGRSGNGGSGAARGIPRLTWTSSNPSVARVSADGLVEGVTIGDAVITVASGTLATFSKTKVTARGVGTGKGNGNPGGGSVETTEPQLVGPVATTLTVTPASAAITSLGASAQLSASVLDQTGAAISGSVITWASQNPEIASVDGTGKVIARLGGIALIVASSGGLADTATVSVGQTVSSVSVTPTSKSLVLGDSVRLVATAVDGAGNTISGVTFNWSSSNAGVASVTSTGLVKALAGGSASVTATASGTQVKASSAISVTTSTVVAPVTGIQINPGESIQAKVDANPTGTVFTIKAGTHLNQQVAPKTGQQFIGEPGAILDGGGTTRYAFTGDARGRDVVIRGLTIQNYANPLQTGAIHPLVGQSGEIATGWTVENNTIQRNAGGGMRIGHKFIIRNNRLLYNRQLGIGGTGDDTLVEGNEIGWNNPTCEIDWGWEGGGTKFVLSNRLTIRGNYSHHNCGPGFWTDWNNDMIVFENNRAEDNRGPGIFHEVSYRAIIRNNQVRRNGGPNPVWHWGNGILISGSGCPASLPPLRTGEDGRPVCIEIHGNTVEDNGGGIGGIQQDRGTGALGPHLTSGMYVHGNFVRARTWFAAGVAADYPTTHHPTAPAANNRFARNKYETVNGSQFDWGEAWKTWDQWKGFGNDSAGSITY